METECYFAGECWGARRHACVQRREWTVLCPRGAQPDCCLECLAARHSKSNVQTRVGAKIFCTINREFVQCFYQNIEYQVFLFGLWMHRLSEISAIIVVDMATSSESKLKHHLVQPCPNRDARGKSLAVLYCLYWSRKACGNGDGTVCSGSTYGTKTEYSAQKKRMRRLFKKCHNVPVCIYHSFLSRSLRLTN